MPFIIHNSYTEKWKQNVITFKLGWVVIFKISMNFAFFLLIMCIFWWCEMRKLRSLTPSSSFFRQMLTSRKHGLCRFIKACPVAFTLSSRRTSIVRFISALLHISPPNAWFLDNPPAWLNRDWWTDRACVRLITWCHPREGCVPPVPVLSGQDFGSPIGDHRFYHSHKSNLFYLF